MLLTRSGRQESAAGRQALKVPGAPVGLVLKAARHQVHQERQHLRGRNTADALAHPRCRVRDVLSKIDLARQRVLCRRMHGLEQRGGTSSSGAEMNWNSMNAMMAGRVSRKPNDANSAGDVRTTANSENDSSRCACVSARFCSVCDNFQCPAPCAAPLSVKRLLTPCVSA